MRMAATSDTTVSGMLYEMGTGSRYASMPMKCIDQMPMPPSATAAQVTTAQLRQMWPQVLEAVKNRRRFAWMTLGPNAQVLDVTSGRLTLAFNNPGARESFVSHGGSEVLHAALIDVIGAALEIDTVIEGRAAVDDLTRRGGPSGGGGPNPSERASAQARQTPADSAGAASGAEPGRDPWAEPDPAAVPDAPAGGPSGAAAPPGPSPSPPPAPVHHVLEPPAGPEDAYDPDADVSMDDAPVEESDGSAAQLLIDELGAELIEEIPNEPAF